jgi:hypothetical protein
VRNDPGSAACLAVALAAATRLRRAAPPQASFAATAAALRSSLPSAPVSTGW